GGHLCLGDVDDGVALRVPEAVALGDAEAVRLVHGEAVVPDDPVLPLEAMRVEMESTLGDVLVREMEADGAVVGEAGNRRTDPAGHRVVVVTGGPLIGDVPVV